MIQTNKKQRETKIQRFSYFILSRERSNHANYTCNTPVWQIRCMPTLGSAYSTVHDAQSQWTLEYMLPIGSMYSRVHCAWVLCTQQYALYRVSWKYTWKKDEFTQLISSGADKWVRVNEKRCEWNRLRYVQTILQLTLNKSINEKVE